MTAGLALALACSVTGQASPRFEGTVVDRSGKPLDGAEIARYFMADHGRLAGQGVMKTDAEGRFSWSVQGAAFPLTYIVLDKDHRLGACVKVRERGLVKPLKVVLKPLGEIGFRPKAAGDFGPTPFTTSFGFPDATAIVVQSLGPGPFLVPEGTYELSVFGPDIERWAKTVTVRSGAKLDLGVTELPLSPAARNVGKPALPLDFAEARGVAPGFTWADLKGKWVLLEFWGFW